MGDYDVKLNDPAPTLDIKLNNIAKTWGPKRGRVAFILKRHCIVDELGWPTMLPLIPDFLNPVNQIAACIHRFGCLMPDGLQSRVTDFEIYAKNFIVENLDPLEPDELISFDEWLEGTPYDQSRKKYLRETRESIEKINMEHMLEVLSFIKNEGYQEPKNPRAINSPCDAYKVLTGNVQKSVDIKTFKLPWFVKGSDPTTWPRRMHEMLGDSHVVGTDFSSFEAHHRDAFSNVIHFWMNYMTSKINDRVYNTITKRLLIGTNKCKFKMLTAQIDQRLMSGAMWTSSSNGILNLLISSYLAMRTKYPNMDPIALSELAGDEFKGLFEGDDGIALDTGFSDQLIEELGLKLKFSRHEHFSEASFCSIICSRDGTIVVTDPRKIIRKFFVMETRYRDMRIGKIEGLLRARALSYKYLYGNTPIVGALFDRVLSNTVGVDPRAYLKDGNWFLRDVTQTKVLAVWKNKANVTMEARIMVEKSYGITIDNQLYMEACINSNKKGPITMELGEIANSVDRDHAARYLTESGSEPMVVDYVNLPAVIQAVLLNNLVRVKTDYKSSDKAFISQPQIAPSSEHMTMHSSFIERYAI